MAQSVHALAEVHRSRRDQHPGASWYRDHTDLNASRTARSVRSSILPRTVTRISPGKTISIVPIPFVAAPHPLCRQRWPLWHLSTAGDHGRHEVWQRRGGVADCTCLARFTPPL